MKPNVWGVYIKRVQDDSSMHPELKLRVVDAYYFLREELGEN